MQRERDDPRARRCGNLLSRRSRRCCGDACAPVSRKGGGAARRGSRAAPKALIAPHAGYVYSGPIAGSAYATIEPLRDRIERVVLIGPSHRVAFRGLALSSAAVWRTPLGDVPLDRAGAAALEKLPQVRVFDAAHAEEHSLEVQLPFLQETLGSFLLLPLVAGDATPQEVAQVLERAWGGPETLIVVSSDLSHYYDYATARSLDRVTTRRDRGASRRRARRAERVRPRAGARAARRRARARSRRAHARPAQLGRHGGSARSRGGLRGVCVRVSRRDGNLGTRAATLLHVARASIEHVLRTGRPLEVDVEEFSPALREPRASFVTLRSGDGALRGCIGELEPRRALVASVADRARAAAFGDPRFPPLRADELDALAIHVSVLLPLAPIDARSEAELVAQLRPGVDGLLIDDGVRRATFLPAVWNSLPDPHAFLRALRRKAGMPAGDWPATLRAWRYEVEEIGPTAGEADRVTAR